MFLKVILLDTPMPETSNIEEKQITEEILLTNNNNSKKQAISKKTTNNNNNRKPPSARSANNASNQINSYNNKYNQHNYQNMTVRINPLIFKQQQNSQPFQISFTKHKQQQQKQQLKKPQVAFEMISNLNQHHHHNNYLNQNLIEQNNQFEFGQQTNEFLNNDTHLCLETIVDTFQANK